MSYMDTRIPNPRPVVLARYLKLAENLAQVHDGKLPHVTWLRRNGHANLDQYMRAHRGKFSHIKQDKRDQRGYEKSACDRQVKLAKKLAKNNRGQLPSVARLMEQKRAGLLSYMNKHPSFFVDIQQNKEHKSSKEHVRAAEELARDNGGCLPGGGKISQKGWDLYKFMKRNPQHFVHIDGAVEFFNNTRKTN